MGFPVTAVVADDSYRDQTAGIRLVPFLHQRYPEFDFGAAGGWLLLADLFLVGALAIYWEDAGRLRLWRTRSTKPL